MKKTLQLIFLGMSPVLFAADNPCCTTPPAPCYPDEPICAYCVGPDMVNPSVRPRSCDGSWLVTLAGFYWNSHQDGMEFAVDNSVFVPTAGTAIQTRELNNLIDAEYKNPNYQWDFGFKAGLSFNSTHDGWDIGLLWTWYRGSASNHLEAESDDNHTLIPLWSALGGDAIIPREILYATDIEAHWSMRLNLVDVELGREFWLSKYLTIRPHIGIRFASLDQTYKLNHKGGIWLTIEPISQANNEVNMRNDFWGVGGRGGFNTAWNMGKGFAIKADTAVSIIYGRFKVKHDEWNREVVSPFSKTRILETEDHFRASRAMTDLSLGLQWSTPFGMQCQYHFTIGIDWEHHMFFDQNQLWRVNRFNDTVNQGENAYYQRRGDLDTQGWTFTLQFEF